MPKSYSAEADLENGIQSTETCQEAPGSPRDSFRARERSSASGVRCGERRPREVALCFSGCSHHLEKHRLLLKTQRFPRCLLSGQECQEERMSKKIRIN